MNVVNKANLPVAAEFIEAELSNYDTSKIDWFNLLPLNKHIGHHGYCRYPKRTAPRKRSFVHQYQIRCSVNVRDGFYPRTEDIPVGTETIESDSNVNMWHYLTELVRFKSPTEMAVYLAGHESFHFLRHSKQVPGRNTECQANRFGLDWLEKFRTLEWT